MDDPQPRQRPIHSLGGGDSGGLSTSGTVDLYGSSRIIRSKPLPPPLSLDKEPLKDDPLLASKLQDEMNMKHIKASFLIVLDRLRRTLRFDPIVPGTSGAEASRLKNEFSNVVDRHHAQIFNACGYYDWIRRNTEKAKGANDAIQKFECAELTSVVEKTNKRLKDLILREVIWTCAEQIRHCPQRLNQLFDNFSNSNENRQYYNHTKNKIIDVFLYKKKAPLPEFQEAMEEYKIFPPIIDPVEIKNGIDEFMKGDQDIIFDDIDDCGRWSQPKFSKTFVEIPGSSVVFLILKYLAGSIQLKLWTGVVLFFLYEFGTPIPSTTQKVGPVPAIRGFVIIDFIVNVVFLLNDWILRLCLTRQYRWSSMTHTLRARLALHLLQPVLTVVGVVVGLFIPTASKEPVTWLEAIDRSGYPILGMRVLLSCIPELFPFSPMVNTKPEGQPTKTKRCKFQWDSIVMRYLARLGFIALVIGLSSLYEWWLIVPTVSLLFKKPYCGDPNWGFMNATSYTQLNVHHYICMLSTVWLWWITVLSFIIDNGLVFILVMSLVGWIRGFKTQGRDRSNVEVKRTELMKQLSKRFITIGAKAITPLESVDVSLDDVDDAVDANDEEDEVDHDDGPKKALLPSVKNRLDSIKDVKFEELPPDLEGAKALWDWAVKYWMDLDLLSDTEHKHLLDTSKPIIETNLIASPDAEKHIAFFMSTLDVDPIYNYPFQDIPSVSIVIPVYSEKLMFSWDAGAAYSPKAEFEYLVAKFPEEWLNFTERIQRPPYNVPAEQATNLETFMFGYKMDSQLRDLVTNWLSMRDQYIYKCAYGACSAYDALVQLAMLEGKLPIEEARVKAKEKLQVILCVQLYQSRAVEQKGFRETIAHWLRTMPCLCIVFDYDGSKKGPPECEVIDKSYPFATCLLEWDFDQKCLVVRHAMPRKYPLRIKNIKDRFIQGKSMNQVYGMTYAFGNYIQVLDANQGAHATEYLKFSSLLRDFKANREEGPRYRIIGSREYIYTKNLGTVARCHAYQEWSFGTLVLRTYSDLGIRLHYGHPDVFHGPWATAHSGLSKVNPDINTSEDVFAGFQTMKCVENTKHVEHIQFQKGRETGLPQMSGFDKKISEGNVGLLRSRDVYHLMERLDFPTGFLMFQGVSGHFTTISLMMFSMKMYIMGLFLLSLSGASLKAFGGLTYSTEWIVHAGLITVVPLVVEFLVEYGIVLGTLRSLFFLPISTMIYLFQMQTKHAAFSSGIMTGAAAHIDTGRGLQIYRYSMARLFTYYASSHYMPTFFIMALTFAYYSLSYDLGGGTLPLIMIYVLCISILIAPQVFNPTIKGNDFQECLSEFMAFVIWVGKTEARIYLKDWIGLEKVKKEDSFSGMWLLNDMHNISKDMGGCVRSFFYHTMFFVFWSGVCETNPTTPRTCTTKTATPTPAPNRHPKDEFLISCQTSDLT